jgi:hypothetical protein
MRRAILRCAALVGGAALAIGLVASRQSGAAAGFAAAPKTAQGFQKGAWDYKAIGPLAFSPDGVLFFADDQAGAIYGVDLGEQPAKAAAHTQVPDLGATLAGRLGTTPAGIQIKDVAVSPISQITYISVRKTDGGDQNAAAAANYALFAVDPSGKVSAVDLAGKPFGKVAVAATPGRRDNRLIADIAYADGRVLVAALSTEAFNSNLVSVPVPFRADGVERYATSIYHVSHKRQETASPIQTLTIYQDGGKQYLMAAYVCTPVVRFNLEDLKPNQVAQGTTVAELGSGNQPMNMVAYGKAGEQSLLLDNSVFGILKVDAKIAKERQAVNEATVADRGGRGSKPYPGIEPVASLKDAKAYAVAGSTLIVLRPTEGGMTLQPMPLP